MVEVHSRALGPRRLVVGVAAIVSGGIGSYVLGLSAALASSGWEIHLLVTNEKGNLFDEARRGLIVHDISHLPLSAEKVRRATSMVNSIAPEILLLNHCPLLHYGLPLLTSRIRPIAVVHSDDRRYYVTATVFRKWIFRWVVPTSKLARRLPDYIDSSQRDRIRLIPHGVDMQRYARPRLLDQEKSVITFVGFVETNKGADLLPAILAIVAAAVPSVVLNIVGDGPLRVQLEDDFRRRGLLDRCVFMGQRRREDVASILMQSDLLIHPTRIEGFGLTIIEAMAAAAVPVVTCLDGVTDDIIEHGVHGVLVELNDIEGFAKNIIDLLLDSATRIRMARAATERVERKFSASAMICGYLEMFDEPDDRGGTEGPVGRFRWTVEALLERFSARLKT